MANLVTRHGGITYAAPCLREVHEPDSAETRLAVDLICGNWLDVVVFLTGVGVQTIVDAARLIGREQPGRRSATQARRGARAEDPQRPAETGCGCPTGCARAFTSDALLTLIEQSGSLRGDSVLVQRYGAPVPALCAGLQRMGAQVIEVSPYRWERPQDEEPVVRLIEDLAAGWIDVLAATSAAQVDHLFEIARQRGCERSLRDSLARPGLHVAAQGVVCASAFQRRGIRVDLVPPRASMGSLIVEIANRVDGRPRTEAIARADETVAIFASQDAGLAAVERALDGFGPHARITVLAGQSRLVEQVCVARGLAVECVRPSADGAHPADEMIRRATRVVIVTGLRRSLDVGRVLRLAERYAKRVDVVRPPN